MVGDILNIRDSLSHDVESMTTNVRSEYKYGGGDLQARSACGTCAGLSHVSRNMLGRETLPDGPDSETPGSPVSQARRSRHARPRSSPPAASRGSTARERPRQIGLCERPLSGG
eukprot:6540962-Pyramimonas_sp.AAC.3